jgi:hypothetical protein
VMIYRLTKLLNATGHNLLLSLSKNTHSDDVYMHVSKRTS